MSDKKQSEVRITGVGSQLKQDLKTVSDKLGITVTSFIKPLLREAVNQHLKK